MLFNFTVEDVRTLMAETGCGAFKAVEELEKWDGNLEMAKKSLLLENPFQKKKKPKGD